MTVTSVVLSMVYPVAGGAGVALTTRALLESARRFVVGSSKTPPGHEGGRTALVWTALSWTVSVGVGFYAGKKLVRKAVVAQPAQS